MDLNILNLGVNKMEALKELPKKIDSYKNGELSFDKLVTFIKNNFSRYTVWKDHPVTQRNQELEFRNYILSSLGNMLEPLVKENNIIDDTLIKNDKQIGILVSYVYKRIFIVENFSIDIYSLQSPNEPNVQPDRN